MPKHVLLPTNDLKGKHYEFVSAWEISSHGMFVPPSNGQEAAYAWPGRYVCGSTVVLAASENNARYPDAAPFSVGVAEEADYQAACQAGVPAGEFYADIATCLTRGGIWSAIYMLNLLRGLPDGSQLVLGPPPALVK
jgi:hypothetical protein